MPLAASMKEDRWYILVDRGDYSSKIKRQSVVPAVPTNARQRKGVTISQQVPANLEKPENCYQRKQMDGAVQPSGRWTLWTTIQDCDEKVKVYPITERMEPEAVDRIVDQLFLQLPALVVTPWEAVEGTPLMTASEIDVTVDWVRTKARQAPMPDGILNSVWTIVHWTNPAILDVVFISTLKSWAFPTRMKVVWLVLLQKPDRPVGDATSFRPLCMLDTIGKNFEQAIAKWLRKHFESALWMPYHEILQCGISRFLACYPQFLCAVLPLCIKKVVKPSLKHRHIIQNLMPTDY